jgi:hypothetical protein
MWLIVWRIVQGIGAAMLFSQPFHHGLVIVFGAAIVMSAIGALASLVRDRRYVHAETPTRTPVAAAGR